jgi:hypothetical protein
MSISQAGRARALLSSVKTLREKWAQNLSYMQAKQSAMTRYIFIHIQLLAINRLIVFRESLKADGKVLAHDQSADFY